MKLVYAALVAVLACSAATSTCCPNPRTISVSGEGEVSLSPDKVTVTFSVISNATSPTEAAQANTDASAAVIDSLTALGVGKTSIRLESLSLRQLTEYIPGRKDEPSRTVVTGYEARRDVAVDLTDTSGDAEFPLLAPLLSTIVTAGANTIQGVTFSLLDPSAARADALEAATRDALLRATSIVSGLGQGYALGAVLSVSEGSVGGQPFAPMAKFAFAEAADAPTTQQVAPPGQLTITATVTLVAELLGGPGRGR